MTKKFLYALLIVFIILPFSCKEDPEPEPEPEEPTEADILNEWIWDVMNDYYFWAEDINQQLYPTLETDPEAFFYSILHKDDKFSWIVDDYQALVNSFNNIEVSSGISPYFIRVSNSDDVVIIVEYVVKDSPADVAGIERGDIITAVNGIRINTSNYVDLFYTEEATYSFADYVNQTLVYNDRQVSVTAVVLEENPVLHTDIIYSKQSRIGYIAYTGFSTGEDDKWIDELNSVISRFKGEGITDLVIDIRYNPGGYVSVAQHLASMICPAATLGQDNVLVQYQWNPSYQAYITQQEGENSENLVVLFEDNPYMNLDLSKVYFLTSNHSASASELIIIGLRPYMDVVQIGENTYGKFYGSFTINDIVTPPRHNWAMQPIVFKYANSVGYTDFVNGVIPDYPIEDNMLDTKPFGDINDPMLAKAVEDITGVSPLTTKAVQKPVDYEVLPDPVRMLKNRAIQEISPSLLKDISH